MIFPLGFGIGERLNMSDEGRTGLFAVIYVLGIDDAVRKVDEFRWFGWRKGLFFYLSERRHFDLAGFGL